LRDSSRTDGTLLVGLKEPLAARGVSVEGVSLPVLSRFQAEQALRQDIPALDVVRGVEGIFVSKGPAGERTDTIYRTWIAVRPDSVSDQFVERLLAHPNVDYVEANTVVGHLDRKSVAWVMSTQVRPWGVASIGAPIVWADGYDGGGTSLGMADTGADLFPSAHPDLDFPSAHGNFTNHVEDEADNPCPSSS